MLRLYESIDMIIPRGGNGLHTFCRENSSIPVITGGIGVCHIFVDASADLDKALPVLDNAKTQRPAVCNSMETLLVHRAVAAELLPQVVEVLGAAGVEFHAEAAAYDIVGADTRVVPAAAADFDTEWYNLTLNLKVVDDVDEAIAHIGRHGTQHSDSILTRNACARGTVSQRGGFAAVFGTRARALRMAARWVWALSGDQYTEAACAWSHGAWRN